LWYRSRSAVPPGKQWGAGDQLLRIAARARRQVVLKIAENVGVDIGGRPFALENAVSATGINAHVEGLAERNELVNEQLEALEMDIVVAGAVHHEQATAKAPSEGDGGPRFVGLGALLRQAHVALLVDAVIEPLVRYGSNGDPDAVE